MLMLFLFFLVVVLFFVDPHRGCKDMAQGLDRRSMSYNGSRAYFSATADKTHYKNVKPRPMRGGIRL